MCKNYTLIDVQRPIREKADHFFSAYLCQATCLAYVTKSVLFYYNFDSYFLHSMHLHSNIAH